ncbi:MAG: hypothetical protein ACHQT9_01500 [Candidatus Saccharimonadales bacterium]
MRITWNQIPEATEETDIFSRLGEGHFSVGDFMAGVAQIIRETGSLTVTQELQRSGSLPMRYMLDEVESSFRFGPRTQSDQAIYERIDLLQTLASIRDSRIGGGLKEIEIATQEDGSLAWAYFK